MNSADFILALDQGTTSSRAILFDRAGGPVAVAQREFEQRFPQPGWVEHDAEEIWRTQLGVAEEVMRRVGAGTADVAAIGITNQRETTVLWERSTGKAIHNALVWQDRRTAAAIDELNAGGHAATITARTGLVPDAYFSATKAAWILDNVPGARDRAAAGEIAFGTIDSWLLFRLTGGMVHATDASNASRTMLFDIQRGAWDNDLLELFGIPAAVLPEVVDSAGVLGEVAVDSPLRGLPVAAVIGDQQAALAGQICFDAGQAKCTYGTGCFMLVNTGSDAAPSQCNLLSTVAWQRDSSLTYALEGSVFVGGALVQWLRDGLGLIRSSDEVEALAGSVSSSEGVYLVPAFAGLGAPHWDAHARGIICGLTRGTTSAHIARAGLEAIAFQVADLLDAMRADTGLPIGELRVDGGAANNELLLQIQADLLQIPVIRPASVETTALGAALMAGLATGFWTDPTELAEQRAPDRVTEPRAAADDAGERRRRWAEAVERAKGWDAPGS